jgi:hypothetical protein
MNNKKSQTEMMGLALIVVIITIAMVFVIRFGVLDTPEEHKQEYTQTEMASNFVSTLLKTTTSCRDLTFTELFQNVAEGEIGYIDCGNGDSSKDLLITELNSILDSTLRAWGIAFDFSAKISDTDIIPIESNLEGCPGERKSKQFAIPVDAAGGTTLYVKLDVCS